ncbi:PREDICTED: uncharacterized protein LOC106113400 [Papilio xuthus]|uniref:histone acetyltransferase n=1 Tax=Papilio xuthus TaxID=66420 RepID=A0AAJ7E3S1_PAPXU|nr:PREDICTED: uncharacterized protein LOC106113400 [Papilio xuthus]
MMQNYVGGGGGRWRIGRREKMEIEEALEAALPGSSRSNSRSRPRPGMALQSVAKRMRMAKGGVAEESDDSRSDEDVAASIRFAALPSRAGAMPRYPGRARRTLRPTMRARDVAREAARVAAVAAHRSVPEAADYEDIDIVEYEFLFAGEGEPPRDMQESPPPGAPGPRRLQPAPVNAVVRTRAEEEERRRLIRAQLATLLHAHECRADETRLRHAIWYCNVPSCQEIKYILRHLTVCQNRTSCKKTYCVSSRQIIGHWKNCENPQCPICLPLPTPGLVRKVRRNRGSL